MDQRLANENIARLTRCHGAVIHSSFRSERQAIQAHSLERGNESAGAHPVRLAVGLLDQVRTGGLDPQGIHPCHHARVDPGRLDDTPGDDPFRRTSSQRSPGRNHEARAARSVVLAFLAQAADRAEKTGENGLVQLRVTRRHLVGPQLQLANGLRQLPVKLLPFAQAHE